MGVCVGCLVGFVSVLGANYIPTLEQASMVAFLFVLQLDLPASVYGCISANGAHIVVSQASNLCVC